MQERRAKPEATYVGRPLRWRLIAKPAAATALLAVALAASAQGAEAPGFELTSASVAPRSAFYDGIDPVTVRFRFSADGPSDVSLRFRRRGRLVRRLYLPDLEPGLQRIEWDGALPSGRAAPDGAYRAFVKPVGGAGSPAGRFQLHGHVFPVRASHGERGATGEFRAPRSGGRVHEGFDIVTKCGAHLVAVRAGRVTHRGYDPVLYGHFIEIKGRGQRRSYFYSHLRKPPGPKRGALVRTGERVGRVGRTGNARYVPGCHLHFEIHRRGMPIDPRPDLRRWDRWS